MANNNEILNFKQEAYDFPNSTFELSSAQSI